jgi:hypothetical protein
MKRLRADRARLEVCRRGAIEAQSAGWATGLGHDDPFA